MSLKKSIMIWVNDFINLFYPNLCAACGNYLFKNEKVICTKCLYHLPKTDFHLQKHNPVSILFWGRVPIEYAAALYTFSKGSKYQKLIHKLKYHGAKEIGIELGKLLGYNLHQSEYFQEIDIIIPVPLHPKKQKIRGYNQAEVIADGISQSMKKPVVTNSLIRTVHTQSQTKKNKLERWENVDNIFGIQNREQLSHLHVLLVDDVVTTGSTLEACAHALQMADDVKVSIAILAYA